jgi:hypothetical protein
MYRSRDVYNLLELREKDYKGAKLAMGFLEIGCFGSTRRFLFLESFLKYILHIIPQEHTGES